MEKTNQDLHHHHQQQQQQLLPPLKCPRCDSLNTKFCYYNNYSLSQPRHFCKACKRYWTRGGTLRNVPVGGGCRKNKRVKRLNTSVPAPTPVISSSNNHTTLNLANPCANPLLYNQSDVSVRLPRLTSSNLYDVGSQINAFEFGFSSLGGCGFTSQGYGGDNGKDYKIQIHPTTQMSDVVTSNSLLPNFPFFLGSSSSTTNSLVPSTLQQQTRPTHNFPSLSDQMTIMKEMKVEEGNKEMNQNTIEPIGLFDSSAYWNMMNAGAWADITNYGSSVTSLI